MTKSNFTEIMNIIRKEKPNDFEESTILLNTADGPSYTVPFNGISLETSFLVGRKEESQIVFIPYANIASVKSK